MIRRLPIGLLGLAVATAQAQVITAPGARQPEAAASAPAADPCVVSGIVILTQSTDINCTGPFVMNPNSRIVMGPHNLTITAQRGEFRGGPKSRPEIVAFVEPAATGNAGAEGPKGQSRNRNENSSGEHNGLTALPGGSGTHGTRGLDGAAAGTLQLNFSQITEGHLLINKSGQMGGSGGRGGRGGPGGDGERGGNAVAGTVDCRRGPGAAGLPGYGGVGGNGGPGGNGGRGGNVVMSLPQSDEFVVEVLVAGGAGGPGGEAGGRGLRGTPGLPGREEVREVLGNRITICGVGNRGDISVRPDYQSHLVDPESRVSPGQAGRAGVAGAAGDFRVIVNGVDRTQQLTNQPR